MNTSRCISALGVSILTALPVAAQIPEKPVRLVLQITVDQLLSDLIERYSAGYGEGGFHRLLNNGTFYIDAHHRHANTGSCQKDSC
jgi:hypothetical protein